MDEMPAVEDVGQRAVLGEPPDVLELLETPLDALALVSGSDALHLVVNGRRPVAVDLAGFAGGEAVEPDTAGR